MKVLIDIGHPAHVHLFKHFAWEIQGKGHEIFFTCREKEFEIYLLEKYGFLYRSFGKKYASKMGKIWGLIEFDAKELIAGLNFKPDVFLSHGSIYAAHASFLLKKPNIALEDTFNFEQLKFSMPFSDVILAADYDHPIKALKKVVSYAGYHELAYLHPNRFHPDRAVLKELGVKANEKYVIMRFIAWQATHDFGHKGISLGNKIRAVREFEKHARVFISSETELPRELQQYKIALAPERIHDAMAFAALVFGESGTMASEAAVLGIPGIFLDNTSRCYTREQENNYGLVFNFSESDDDQVRAIKKGIEILKKKDSVDLGRIKKNQLLKDKIDVTAFMAWFIENYPVSFRIMKKNPDYQHRFK